MAALLLRHFAAGLATGLLVVVVMAGCANGGDGGKDPGAIVPAAAKRVGNRAKTAIRYVATARGTVYVYDASDRRLVYTLQVNANDEVVLQPAKRAIALNQLVISRPKMVPEHIYRLYFLKAAG